MSETKPKKKKVYRQSKTGVYLKKVIFERIKIINGIPRHQIWYFRAQDFPCGSCHGYGDVAFIIQNGVYWTCTNCGITYEVEPYDHRGKKIAILLQDKEVTAQEVVEICNRIGQKIPVQFRETRKEVMPEEIEKELEEEFGKEE
jgi:RecJ-like exonuclease